MFDCYLDKLLNENHPFWDQVERTQVLKTGKLIQKDIGFIEYIPSARLALSPLILSCGIHGNETAPIEMLSDLLEELSQEKFSCHRPVLFVFAHREGMKVHQRFVEYNLNRLFNGQHKNTPDFLESPIALKIEKAVHSFQASYGLGTHLDLHTAMRGSQIQKFAIGPLSSGEGFSIEAKKLLESLGIQAVVHTDDGGTTFSSYTKSQFGYLSFTLELGKVKPFGENNREEFQDTYEGLKDCLNQNENSALKKRSDLKEFIVERELLRDSEEYEFFIPDDYINFTTFNEGDLIQKGKEGNLIASKDQCLIFPNKNVPIGQRTGLLLKPISDNP